MDMEVSHALAVLESALSERKLYGYEPYVWQREFHGMGVECNQRMLMAANRVGKTEGAAAEVAMHATGEYPDWWEGK